MPLTVASILSDNINTLAYGHKDIPIIKEKQLEEYKPPPPPPPPPLKKNKIKPDDLKKLDEFIQNCLNKFVFIDTKKSFYDATGDDKDFIISHKSTIPDLVIWNKNFNKNECYVEADKTKENSFPRFRFYLRLNNDNNNQKEKEKKTKKNRQKPFPCCCW